MPSLLPTILTKRLPSGSGNFTSVLGIVLSLFIAAAIILPRLDSYGFWEPMELSSAQNILQILAEPEDSSAIDANNLWERKRAFSRQTQFLSRWLGLWSSQCLGEGCRFSEAQVRLPVAMLAMLSIFGVGILGCILTTFVEPTFLDPLGSRQRAQVRTDPNTSEDDKKSIGRCRVPCIAMLVLATSPIFILQSRQLLGNMLGVTTTIWLACALIGMLTTRSRLLLWGGATVCALLVSLWASGVLMGVAVPCLAAGVTAYSFVGLRPAARMRWIVLGTLLCLIGLAGVLYVGSLAYDLVPPIPGKRQLFGYSLSPTGRWIHELQGVWKPRGDLDVLTAHSFPTIVFGMFPWCLLAPFAVFVGIRQPKVRLLATWAIFAWAVGNVLDRRVASTLFTEWGLVAVCIAVWTTDVWQRRTTEKAAWPLVGVFVLGGGFVLGKDILAFPKDFVSMHLSSYSTNHSAITWTVDKLELAPSVRWWTIGVVVGAAIWVVLLAAFFAYRKLQGRWIVVSFFGAVAGSLYLGHIWLPAVSQTMSTRHVFSTVEQHATPKDNLIVQGKMNGAPQYYAKIPYKIVRHRQQVITGLQKDMRTFAIVPNKDLCSIKKSMKHSPYYVIDNTNHSYLLLSNQLTPGHLDQNPLAHLVGTEMPTAMSHQLNVQFGDNLRLIGADFPSEVSKGRSFDVTLYYKVLAPISKDWKVLLHVDGPATRLNGDHKPIGGLCGTRYWQAGDYVVDRFTVRGKFASASGDYALWTGYFHGSRGNFTNMGVNRKETSMVGQGGTSDKPRKKPRAVTVDENNRVRIGTIAIN